MLPRFEPAGRRRPVDLVVPGSTLEEVVAPYAAATGPGPALELASGGDRLLARYDGDAVWLEVTSGGRTTVHRSRRFGRPGGPVAELGLTLTGSHVTVLSRAARGAADTRDWMARGRVDLADLADRVDTRDEAWLAGLAAEAPRAGRFGQLGLRDIRLVTRADGSAYSPGGRPLLTATSAGPGFFDTAHTSVWELDPDRLELSHRADLFFRRPDRPGAYGDHATHLVRDGGAGDDGAGDDEDGRWLVATSTWGDFDRRHPAVGITLATSTEDLLTGVHLLDTEPLRVPTDGLRSVGVWDPHLVRTDEGWLVGFVSARRFFRFHPALAAGPSLEALTLRAAAADRLATEGTTLARIDGAWRVLASDGRDGRRGQRERYPVFDLDLREIGTLRAPYPTNIPWPTLVPVDGSWLLVGFDGRGYGGPLPGYGTHGDVVFARPAEGTTV